MSESSEIENPVVDITDSSKYVVAKAVLDHIDKERKSIHDKEEMDNHWNSCCLTMDKAAVKFFTQVGVCSSIILFCGVSLIIGIPSTYVPLYTGLMSFSAGLLFPQPVM